MPQETKTWRSCFRSPIWKEAIAEFWGTYILLIFGQGSNAQYVLSNGSVGSTDQVRWAWGFGVVFGVFVSGGISGGHINPAVTLGLCMVKKCSWKRLLPFWFAQYLGAFLASATVYVVYYDAFGAFDSGDKTLKTAGIFATYPSPYLSVWNGLADQVFGTCVLVFLVMALTDPKNMSPAKGYLPFMIGLIVVAIGMTFSLNCGYAINPARDLAPRLFTLAAGWGTQVFSVNDYKWFWIPIIGPYTGAVIGAFIYVLSINLSCPYSTKTCRTNQESYAVEQVEDDKI